MRQIFKNGELWLGDCLELMAEIPDGSVDMILCDLPYGTTRNKWDSLLPLDRLWAAYWRLAKPNAAIVLTAGAPFDKVLAISQLASFKYQWVWEKPNATGFLNANKAPLRAHELILIFGKNQLSYSPQKTTGGARKRVDRSFSHETTNYGKQGTRPPYDSNNERYPRDVVKFSKDDRSGRPHPTQKPVALFEYLIRTYSSSGELVLDNCSGSGTTAIAALNTGRRFLCIEKDVEYYLSSCDRVLACV